MNTETIPVVIIGFGHIGKRHAKIIQDSRLFRLVALIDRNFVEGGTHTSQYEVPHFNHLDDFFTSGPQAALAVIATPNGVHQLQMERCLENGLHIVTEKPIALESAAIVKIQAIAQKKDLHIFPVIQNRYAKTAKWLKSVINSGYLGKIFLIQVNCFWNRDERYYKPESWHGDRTLDGGSLYTQFLHFIDMIYWLLGDMKIADRVFFDFNHQHLSHFEDSGLVRFSFDHGPAEGALGTLQFTTAAWQQNAESSLTLIAEKGSLKIGGQYMEKLDYAIMENFSEKQRQQLALPDPHTTAYGAAAGHYLFWEDVGVFFNSRHGLGQLPTLTEAAAVISIIERIYQKASS